MRFNPADRNLINSRAVAGFLGIAYTPVPQRHITSSCAWKAMPEATPDIEAAKSQDYSFPCSKVQQRAGQVSARDQRPSTSGRADGAPGAAVLVACGSFNPPTVMHLRMFDVAAAHLEKRGCPVLGAYMSPVSDAYGKPGLAPGLHRAAMCTAACADSPLVMVDSWEVQQEGYTRTLAVLQHVKQGLESCLQGPQPRVLLLCGADVLASMAKPGVWQGLDNLLENFGVVCLSRQGTDLEQLMGPGGGKESNQPDSLRPGEAGAGQGEVSSTSPKENGLDDAAETLKAMLRRMSHNITLVDLPDEDTASGIGDLSSSLVRSRIRDGQPISGLLHPAVEQYILKHRLYIE